MAADSEWERDMAKEMRKFKEFAEMSDDLLSLILPHLVRLTPSSSSGSEDDLASLPVILKEGEIQDRVLFVLEGCVTRTRFGVTIETVRGPYTCGLLHAFRHDTAFATILAHPGSVIFSLGAGVFQSLLSAHPPLSLHFLLYFAVRLRSETKWQRERMAASDGVRVVFFDSKEYDVRSFEGVVEQMNKTAPAGERRGRRGWEFLYFFLPVSFLSFSFPTHQFCPFYSPTTLPRQAATMHLAFSEAVSGDGVCGCQRSCDLHFRQ